MRRHLFLKENRHTVLPLPSLSHTHSHGEQCWVPARPVTLGVQAWSGPQPPAPELLLSVQDHQGRAGGAQAILWGCICPVLPLPGCSRQAWPRTEKARAEASSQAVGRVAGGRGTPDLPWFLLPRPVPALSLGLHAGRDRPLSGLSCGGVLLSHLSDFIPPAHYCRGSLSETQPDAIPPLSETFEGQVRTTLARRKGCCSLHSSLALRLCGVTLSLSLSTAHAHTLLLHTGSHCLHAPGDLHPPSPPSQSHVSPGMTRLTRLHADSAACLPLWPFVGSKSCPLHWSLTRQVHVPERTLRQRDACIWQGHKGTSLKGNSTQP